MQSDRTAFFSRDDTLFGVCQALGDDFGIPPTLLRLAFGSLLIVNPVAVIGAYAAAGVVVALSRLAFPDPRGKSANVESAAVTERSVPLADNEAAGEALLVAA
jgi:phage shock protein PspC (stress-responsive transcriptional regulator)